MRVQPAGAYLPRKGAVFSATVRETARRLDLFSEIVDGCRAPSKKRYERAFRSVHRRVVWDLPSPSMRHSTQWIQVKEGQALRLYMR